MTTIATKLMSRARDIAGKVLYAQSRGEDIALVIADAMADEVAAGHRLGLANALEEVKRFPFLVVKSLQDANRRGFH